LERSGLSTEIFGTLANGETVEAVTLTNANGMSVKIIGYGASIQSVCVPDAQGRLADVTTGYATLDEYVAQPQFYGATIGRVANRIAHARFTIDDEEYIVSANDDANSLHGGDVGFDKANWTVTTCDAAALSVTLRHFSPMAIKAIPAI
jgi:aldose 1-epimerase